MTDNPSNNDPAARTTLSDCPRRWKAVARVPGILFTTAALLISFGGATAVDAPADTTVAPAGLLQLDAPGNGPAPEAATQADPSAASDGDAASEIPERLPFRTGDRLDREQLEAFHAFIAKQKADGLHRGAAVYSSWA